MALGSADASSPVAGRGPMACVVPVSPTSNWVDVNTAPTAADNAGSTVLNPGLLTRSAIKVFAMRGAGTSVQIRLKYDSTKSVTTSPVVQVFGFDNKGAAGAFDPTLCEPQRLYDNGTVPGHELTLDDDTTNDVKASLADSVVWAYSEPKTLDALGNSYLMVTVKTAAVQASSGAPVIQMRQI